MKSSSVPHTPRPFSVVVNFEGQDWIFSSEISKFSRSGQVRPRQGTEIVNFGAPSPLEALHWIFCFFSSIYVQFSKTSPLKSGESSENPVEKIASNPVMSVAVMVFSALTRD